MTDHIIAILTNIGIGTATIVIPILGLAYIVLFLTACSSDCKMKWYWRILLISPAFLFMAYVLGWSMTHAKF